MNKAVLLLLALVATSRLAAQTTTNGLAPTWTERPEWQRFFAAAGVKGTMLVVDERTGATWAYDVTRARTRFIPASTFKVPHALFALDAGVVKDEFEVFKWDGTKRDFDSWNQDQTLRSSMVYSAVWVYQQFARTLGDAREREYLKKVGYGNANTSGGVDRFWLDGGLRISAEEEIALLRRLYRNELPFRVEHQRLVKDIMINEAGKDWVLRAKTGWALQPSQIGWWVGWVERLDGPVFFALNIDMAGASDAPKREAVARAILSDIGALPARVPGN